MKTIVISELQFSPKVVKELESQKISVVEAVSNLFSNLASAKFREGVDLKSQKMFSKIVDKLEEDTVELSDEQFDFFYEVFTQTQFPPNLMLPVVAEYLETLKLTK